MRVETFLIRNAIRMANTEVAKIIFLCKDEEVIKGVQQIIFNSMDEYPNSRYFCDELIYSGKYGHILLVNLSDPSLYDIKHLEATAVFFKRGDFVECATETEHLKELIITSKFGGTGIEFIGSQWFYDISVMY